MIQIIWILLFGSGSQVFIKSFFFLNYYELDSNKDIRKNDYNIKFKLNYYKIVLLL